MSRMSIPAGSKKPRGAIAPGRSVMAFIDIEENAFLDDDGENPRAVATKVTNK